MRAPGARPWRPRIPGGTLGEAVTDDPGQRTSTRRAPGAQDLPRLRRFYEALGWTPRDGSNDEFAAFILGGAILALYPRHLLQAEAAADLPPPTPGSWNGVTLAMNVDAREEVDRVFDLAVGAGARPIAPPPGPGMGRALRLPRRPGGQPLGDRLGTRAELHRGRGRRPRCSMSPMGAEAGQAMPIGGTSERRQGSGS